MTALVVALASPAAAQSHAAASDSAFFRALDARGSLEHALEGLRADSNNVAMLGRAARAELALGIVANESGLIQGHLYSATVHARRAIALAPNDAWSHFWLAAAQGRRALRINFRQAVPVAGEAYNEAMRVLAIDSTHAGANEIIGKMHSEVRKLPWVVRKLIAALTKLDMARSVSWETSETYLKRAIALDSTLMIAYVDLSQLYLRTDRRAEAIAIVEKIEIMPKLTPVDGHFQVEARRRLAWY